MRHPSLGAKPIVHSGQQTPPIHSPPGQVVRAAANVTANIAASMTVNMAVNNLHRSGLIPIALGGSWHKGC